MGSQPGEPSGQGNGEQFKRGKCVIIQFLCISQPSRTFFFSSTQALTEGWSNLGPAPSNAGWDARNPKKTGKVKTAFRASWSYGEGKTHTCSCTWQSYVKIMRRQLDAVLGGIETEISGERMSVDVSNLNGLSWRRWGRLVGSWGRRGQEGPKAVEQWVKCGKKPECARNISREGMRASIGNSKLVSTFPMWTSTSHFHSSVSVFWFEQWRFWAKSQVSKLCPILERPQAIQKKNEQSGLNPSPCPVCFCQGSSAFLHVLLPAQPHFRKGFENHSSGNFVTALSVCTSGGWIERRKKAVSTMDGATRLARLASGSRKQWEVSTNGGGN